MNVSPLKCGIAVVALAAGSLLAACGSDDTATTDTSAVTTTTSAATEGVTVGSLELTGAWARTSPAMTSAGAAYLKIANKGDVEDALISASVDPSIAGTVEIHETVAADDSGGSGSMSSTTMDSGSMSSTTAGSMDSGSMSSTTVAGSPMMKMQPVDRIVVPASGSVSLEPGGYHIMLLELAKPLEMGSTIELTLKFENAGEVKVSAPVRDTPP